MLHKDAIDKKLALVLWAEDSEGDDDVAVFAGVLERRGELYYLQREGEGQDPEIRPQWLNRITAVPEELKQTLMGCDYQLSLSVEDLEDGSTEMESFGLKWPGAGNA